MVAKIYPLLTVDDLDSMPDDDNRYEIIEGELLVTRAPKLTHQQITTNIIFLFMVYLKQNPQGKIFPTPGVIFNDFDAVIPDLVYLSHKRYDEIVAEGKIMGAPEIIVEILSPGYENQRRDRQVKRQLYRKHGVKEYWLVDSDTLTITVYRSPQFNRAKRFTIDDRVTSPLLPGFQLNVKDVFEQ
jgi:Uma2 family endonuclease